MNAIPEPYRQRLIDASALKIFDENGNPYEYESGWQLCDMQKLDAEIAATKQAHPELFWSEEELMGRMNGWELTLLQRKAARFEKLRRST